MFLLVTSQEGIWAFNDIPATVAPTAANFQRVQGSAGLEDCDFTVVHDTSFSYPLLVVCASNITSEVQISFMTVTNGAFVEQPGSQTIFPMPNVGTTTPALSLLNEVAVQYSGSSATYAMLATTKGLFACGLRVNSAPTSPEVILLTNTTGSPTTTANATSVFCLPPNVTEGFYSGQCYVGTATTYCLHNICPANLVHRVLGTNESYFYRVPGIIDRLPNGAAFDVQRQAVHFGNDVCVNVLFANDTLYRVEGKTGKLPMNLIQTVASTHDASGTRVWFGSKKGVVLLQPDFTWKYMYGPRWLPDYDFTDNGNDILSLDSSTTTTVVTTPTGVSIIQRMEWTLEEKAKYFQDVIHPRHDREGISATVHLPEWGNLTSYVNGPTANDGLWSSIYLQSQIFRYAVTKDPTAKKNAWKTFDGMMILFNVTGIRGYPARSFTKASSPPSDSWHKSPTM